MNGSAVPRRIIGRELKRLREQSGVSVNAASRSIEISPQTLWRMESGQPGPKLKELYVNILCELYGASAEVTTVLVALVAEVKKPCWWHSFTGVVPEHHELLMELEELADRVTIFHTDLVPDLLQTPDYRNAIARVNAANSSRDQLEQATGVLRHRQARLHTGTSDLGLVALISESVLHNAVGGADVIRGQIQHLATVSERSNITIRIIPLRTGCHPGMFTGPFALLEFPQHPVAQLTEPPVVYLQDYTTARYLDHESEVARYRAAVEEIEHRALDEDASRQLLHEFSRMHDIGTT